MSTHDFESILFFDFPNSKENLMTASPSWHPHCRRAPQHLRQGPPVLLQQRPRLLQHEDKCLPLGLMQRLPGMGLPSGMLPRGPKKTLRIPYLLWFLWRCVIQLTFWIGNMIKILGILMRLLYSFYFRRLFRKKCCLPFEWHRVADQKSPGMPKQLHKVQKVCSFHMDGKWAQGQHWYLQLQKFKKKDRTTEERWW